MPIAISFPSKIEAHADSAALHLLSPRIPTDKETVELAGRLHMKGTVVDEGPLFSVRSEDALLHHFHATDSIRWCRLPPRGEDHRSVALNIRDEAKLRSIAEEFLSELGLRDKEATTVAISYGKHDSVDQKESRPKSVISSAFVNFSYVFQGLPVAGPGAKAQVEIGADGKVLSFYRFWRDTERGSATRRREQRPIVSWATAQKVFRLDPAFAQIGEKAEVVVERARLCYMAMPPRDVQRALFPVYEVRGRVATPQIEKSHFRRYIVAMDYSTDELKKYGITNRQFRGSCRVL
ncbi:MAG TPA: hypothetical protein VF816_16795 [Rhodocyclaceae bacterium]